MKDQWTAEQWMEYRLSAWPDSAEARRRAVEYAASKAYAEHRQRNRVRHAWTPGGGSEILIDGFRPDGQGQMSH